MAAELVSLTDPNGVAVKVSKERAERLVAEGYKTADTKTSAKKAASSKSDD